MIDLHCHLLPGIDDGPRDMGQALALARAAVADGITHAVVTPHIHVGRYQNSRRSIAHDCVVMRAALEREGIDLSLNYAAEIRVCAEIPGLVTKNELPFLGCWHGFRVLLLELPHSHIPHGTEQLFSWLIDRGIRPLIAHPERNRDILRDYNNAINLVDRGCIFQVTAGSLIGQFGEGAKARSLQLLRSGLITLLATDAHHLVRRPPNLSEGRRMAEKLVGESRSWDLVWTNPAVIAAKQFTSSLFESRWAS
ncbi:tyrosine-protein phosphatase [Microbulbifer hainanensis]|uniref:tyrosine-protein phosphatase n=1 Tax=Microbulbifer hainanensis TaxID=2735675 RepID=UPI0018690781|nr:CpsB/CapC family capsule biosynthesis tyrosine phosphatase [Microbulbifer hainanensis]